MKQTTLLSRETMQHTITQESSFIFVIREGTLLSINVVVSLHFIYQANLYVS